MIIMCKEMNYAEWVEFCLRLKKRSYGGYYDHNRGRMIVTNQIRRQGFNNMYDLSHDPFNDATEKQLFVIEFNRPNCDGNRHAIEFLNDCGWARA